MLAKCGTNYIGRSQQVAARVGFAVQKEGLELGAIACAPVARIEAREQAGQRGSHRASSRFRPAWVKLCRVVSLARRTRRPPTVMR